jgi:hypothetical protein
MILCERDIDSDHKIILEHDSGIGLQVSVRDKRFNIAEWVKNTGEDGIKALDIFNHPFFYGYGLER